MEKVCILIVSHNNPLLTDELCEQVIRNTKGVTYDLHVIETGSDLDRLSKYTTLWVKEKCRMTRGWNILRKYADFLASCNNTEYFSYQLLVNDAKLIEGQDMISNLYYNMKNNLDCGQIHPYQTISQSGSPWLNKVNSSGIRKESFAEIVAPMIRKTIWGNTPDLLDSRFFYGWGLDYDIPHQLHITGYRTYISDDVGVTHTPFTSYYQSHITKESLNQSEFVQKARTNMTEVLIEKYGENWKNILIDNIPSDVDKRALYTWISMNEGGI